MLLHTASRNLRMCPWVNALTCTIELERWSATGFAYVHLDPMMPEFVEQFLVMLQLRNGGCAAVHEISISTGSARVLSLFEIGAGHDWTEVALQFEISKNCKYFLFYKVDNVPNRELASIRNVVCESIVCDPIANLAENFNNKAFFLQILNKSLDGDDFDHDDIHHIRTALGVVSGPYFREYILAVKYIMSWN